MIKQGLFQNWFNIRKTIYIIHIIRPMEKKNQMIISTKFKSIHNNLQENRNQWIQADPWATPVWTARDHSHAGLYCIEHDKRTPQPQSCCNFRRSAHCSRALPTARPLVPQSISPAQEMRKRNRHVGWTGRGTWLTLGAPALSNLYLLSITGRKIRIQKSTASTQLKTTG